MPKGRPATSGYARIAQAEEEEEQLLGGAEDDELEHTISSPGFAPIQPGRVRGMSSGGSGSRTPLNGRKSGRRRRRANSGVDIKAINARLEKWADEIASKLKLRKIRGKTAEEEKLEIHYSVFQPPEWIRPATTETRIAQYMDHPEDRLSKVQFDDTVESIKVAMELGIHPKMISQGSSGSYFARNSDGKVVGVFKPKDEEPYASRNPKWTKWIHRNLFPFFFGRACLIPNLSYVSEAAAYVLDTRLQTNIVPYTDIVYFSSPAFYYDLWERRAFYRKGKPLPQKVGSLQVFLRGYKDANIFLKQHPWPDQQTGFRPSSSKSQSKSRWTDQCRPGQGTEEDDDDMTITPGRAEAQHRKHFWTDALQQSFREELEKLVILDYIMRNTDRGLDNWMVRIDEEGQKASIVAESPHTDASGGENGLGPYPREASMTMNGSTISSDMPKPKVMIGAIDNSLSWPWKHPDAWRSFPFGWLFLPVSLIGKPFSQRTREHFLPLLTSKQWWSETQLALRRVFSQDSDFQEKMFARQIAIVKGQAWNVVETLKTPEHGPLELTRRARVHVWDDLVDIPTVVPMREPSDEMRRKRQLEASRRPQQEEMDISAARSPVIHPANEMFGLGPAGDLPNPSRFSLSRRASEDEGVKSPESIVSANGRIQSPLPKARPGAPRARTRLSHEGTRPLPWKSRRAKRRNFSFSAKMLSDQEDEDEGDLGYSAAREMEGNRKKVIVERLETVKGKAPVFTWC